MNKSQILIDFASNKIDLSTALKQLKLLLVDCEKEELIKWVNNELEGYSHEDVLPEYRKFTGFLKGNFLRGAMKYTNTSIPLLKDTPEEVKQTVNRTVYYESILTLQSLVKAKEERRGIGMPIPPDSLYMIQCYSAIPITNLLSAYIEANPNNIIEIFAKVENIVFNTLILLNKEFDDIDSLNIDFNKKSNKNEIITNIYNIVFDNSIKIGDNNRIEKNNFNS